MFETSDRPHGTADRRVLDVRINPAQRVITAGPCAHKVGCHCRRPVIGRALIIAIGIQMLMGIAAIGAGAGSIGLVACGAMATCTWLYAVAEIIAFYRIGLPNPEPARIGQARVVGNPHRPH